MGYFRVLQKVLENKALVVCFVLTAMMGNKPMVYVLLLGFLEVIGQVGH